MITELKAPTYRTHKKYYKWTPWERPNLTGNNSYGWIQGGGAYNGDSGNRAYYKMFDGVLTDGKANHWGTPNVSTGWWVWHLPVKLRVKQLIIHSVDYYSTAADFNIQGRFYTNATKAVPMGEAISITARYTVLTLDFEDAIETSTLYFQKTGGGAYSGFKEIEIVADYLVEADETDYDIVTEYPVIETPTITKNINTFWKIKYKTWSYARPKLSNNTGNSELKVSASSQYNSDYPPYKSFASTSGDTPWISKDGATTAWYQMEFPRPFRITSVFMRNRSSKYDLGAAIKFVFQASDDGTTWEDVTPALTNNVRGSGATWTFYTQALRGYKFYRFNLTKVGGAYISIGFPTFYGEEEYTDTGSPADYSYIETVTEKQKGAVTEPRLAYFKHGPEVNVIRFDTAGTATVEDGIIYNIEDKTRFRIPKKPANVRSYELQFKFKFGQYNDGRIIGNYISNVRAPQIEVPGSADSSGGTGLWFGHPGASEAWTGNTSNRILQIDTWYWVRAIWDGVQTWLLLSEDGRNFTIEAANNSTTCYWSEEFLLGMDEGSYSLGAGSAIDLKESYAKINGEMWWRGTFPVECSEEEAEWSEWINADKPIN